MLQHHQPEVLVGAVNRTTDLALLDSQTTRATAAVGMAVNTPKPAVGFGVYDRRGTNGIIIDCRNETYIHTQLRIRSVKQESCSRLDAREWWNGLNAGANHPIGFLVSSEFVTKNIDLPLERSHPVSQTRCRALSFGISVFRKLSFGDCLGFFGAEIEKDD